MPRARTGRWSAPATVSGCTTCSPRSSLPPTAPALRRPGPPRWNAASRGWTPRRCRPAGAPPAAATRRCAPAPAGSERLRLGRRAGGRASRPSSSRTHQGLSARAAPARPLPGAAGPRPCARRGSALALPTSTGYHGRTAVPGAACRCSCTEQPRASRARAGQAERRQGAACPLCRGASRLGLHAADQGCWGLALAPSGLAAARKKGKWLGFKP